MELRPTASSDMLRTDAILTSAAGLEPAAVAPSPRSSIPTALAELFKADRKQLIAMWHDAFRVAPPSYIGDDFLRRAIAFGLQLDAADAGLKAAHRRIATTSKAGTPATPKVTSTIKPGSRLFREWNGRTYQVHVVEGGFTFDGRLYGSLSEIAREITGTRWSGPAFFGVKKRGGGSHGK